MLMVYGNAYADTKEKMQEIIKALSEDDFIIAYNSDTSIIILKDVEEDKE